MKFNTFFKIPHNNNTVCMLQILKFNQFHIYVIKCKNNIPVENVIFFLKKIITLS